jgi:hypothetical protein
MQERGREKRSHETRCLTVHNVLMNVLIPPEMLAKHRARAKRDPHIEELYGGGGLLCAGYVGAIYSCGLDQSAFVGEYVTYVYCLACKTP